MGNQIHSLQATNTANAETESIYLEVRNVHTSSAACVLEVDLYILLFCPSNPSKGIRWNYVLSGLFPSGLFFSALLYSLCEYVNKFLEVRFLRAIVE